jgi:sugar O-acyltransferase (sialic acid O-acetyltransferase NeuD family)
MAARQIAIYGAGGFAREVAWLVEDCDAGADRYQVVCFIDDNQAVQGTILNGIPVMALDAARERFPAAGMVPAVGTPRTREKLVSKAAAAGFDFVTMIHPRVERSRWIDLGLGTVICAGNILTTNITLGQHVQINLDCTIGHDVIMGDYCTLAPGVHVSGWVHFGKRVYVGTGAVLINGTQDQPLRLEDDVVVGAGACVTRTVSAGLTVVGVPARPLQAR